MFVGTLNTTILYVGAVAATIGAGVLLLAVLSFSLIYLSQRRAVRQAQAQMTQVMQMMRPPPSRTGTAPGNSVTGHDG